MRTSLARFLNTLGYIALYLQYIWVTVLALPWLLEIRTLPIASPAPEPQPSPASHQAANIDPTLAIIVSCVIAAAVVAIAIYAIYKTPKMATDAGEALTTRATQKLLPIATHHKKISKKARYTLSRRLQLGIKLALAAIGFLLTFGTYLWPSALSPALSVTVGLILLPCTVLWFSLAFIFARPAKLS